MGLGTIIAINERRGMFVVKSDDGEYSTWSLNDSIDLELNSRVKGDLDALGSETLLYVSTGEPFEASGESGPSSLVAALRIARQ
ncbi:MAG: hypothetical protein Q8N13_11020 [Acidovorax sp.]|nr:hypothetical protein [Acidovorax sp.]